MTLSVTNETGNLESVIVGIANNNGGVPDLKNVYDPKSRINIIKGTYPEENNMVGELNNFVSILNSYNVDVYRPKLICNYNQIFTRDIGFVIDDKFVISNVLPARSKEIDAINYLFENIPNELIISLPNDAHIEGGDVILNYNKIYVGAYVKSDYSDYVTARTNLKGIEILKNYFPDKEVVLLELNKSNTDPKKNILHLDCCFQPVGSLYAIIHREGFSDSSQLNDLINDFGSDNCFFIDSAEMSEMMCNIFSINKSTVVSDIRFERLNNWMISRGIKVETLSFKEISKQEGLLRCSTLPLNRSL